MIRYTPKLVSSLEFIYDVLSTSNAVGTYQLNYFKQIVSVLKSMA